MDKKIKVLVWADSPTASTGFGTVAKHVLWQLHQTGLYEIDQLAINYYGDFYDKTKFPYQLSPARLLDPNDPFGNKQLIRALQKGDYDILWVLNDTFVVNGVVDQLEKLRADRQTRGLKVFKTIYYYPVDCAVVPEFSRMISFADVVVTYTEWAKKETEKALPNLNKPIHVIYHGSDTENFFPLDRNEKDLWRARYLGIIDPNTFLFINVNRNSVRKDLPKSILAFKEFKKRVPNSMLYMHCAPRDNSIDLFQACKSLGLSTSKDVVFPAHFNLSEGGFPLEVLNSFINASDAFITTTLGEGWGLTITEAMAAGVPVIAPNNTSIPEILGKDKDRGHIYECKDLTWVDNSGYRPMGRVDDIVSKMMDAYKGKGNNSNKGIVDRALKFAQDNTWANVCKNWIKIFDDVVKSTTVEEPKQITLEEV